MSKQVYFFLLIFLSLTVISYSEPYDTDNTTAFPENISTDNTPTFLESEDYRTAPFPDQNGNNTIPEAEPAEQEPDYFSPDPPSSVPALQTEAVDYNYSRTEAPVSAPDAEPETVAESKPESEDDDYNYNQSKAPAAAPEAEPFAEPESELGSGVDDNNKPQTKVPAPAPTTTAETEAEADDNNNSQTKAPAPAPEAKPVTESQLGNEADDYNAYEAKASSPPRPQGTYYNTQNEAPAPEPAPLNNIPSPETDQDANIGTMFPSPMPTSSPPYDDYEAEGATNTPPEENTESPYQVPPSAETQEEEEDLNEDVDVPTMPSPTALIYNYTADDDSGDIVYEGEKGNWDSWGGGDGSTGVFAGVFVGMCFVGLAGFVYKKKKNAKKTQFQYEPLAKGV